MTTWIGREEPAPTRLGPAAWARAALRGLPLALLVFGGLTLLLLLRLIERPLHGVARPWTPHITCFVCRNAIRLMGITYRTSGTPMKNAGALVANHTSWLDIFALNAPTPLYFVSKAEVAGWPGIGWLARATGTVFIRRERTQARGQVAVLAERLAAGHRLLFFPEGTSTDGQQVLPFKPPLFQPYIDGIHVDAPKRDLCVQPVTVNYTAPKGEEVQFYGWWGDMGFGHHFLKTLGAKRQGAIEVIFHAPLTTKTFEGRKQLAKAAEEAVRSALKPGQRLP
ncbi:1-acyl-sn-glycerol-3-phosphate acyltransferase [Alphaproteobacteria bacterium KMM 3653]|uniref:1-acyl-sn-glycerol-3-phosphate acyltransferase n=1 Tax=Harenicola maris TaxID=2841044 RepID=A0AAP2G3G0_9RHOB|nr:1-acyl-sn-glycerol-3-phosphate acyltransferase [Harenicola maris]